MIFRFLTGLLGSLLSPYPFGSSLSRSHVIPRGPLRWRKRSSIDRQVPKRIHQRTIIITFASLTLRGQCRERMPISISRSPPYVLLLHEVLDWEN